MDTQQFDELAGRIDGLAQALLRLTAQLEMAEVIGGPRIALAWRQAREMRRGAGTQLQSSQRTLKQLAAELDAARSYRATLQ